MNFSYKEAFLEATADIFSGMAINFPLNLLIIHYSMNNGFSALQTTITGSVVFMVIAYTRKILIRKKFHERHHANHIS